MIGKTISHYKILEKLGEGGMGVVYKAQDTNLDRYVALKFLPPYISGDEEGKKRFIYEAKTASALDHVNICTIHEIGETKDGQLFTTMGYYDGETLKQKIARGPLKIHEAVEIAIQVAQGLSRAHESDIIHRDIKPANIMITKRDEVKIVDFGIAKLSGRSRITKTGTTLGTTAYMSPEQTRGVTLDHRIDIWSLGVMLYEMLTGKLPFDGDYDQAIIYSINNEDPKSTKQLRSDIPLEIENIILRALMKDPGTRYPSMTKMLGALKLYRRSQIEPDSETSFIRSLKYSLKKQQVLIPAILIFAEQFGINP